MQEKEIFDLMIKAGALFMFHVLLMPTMVDT